MGSENSEGIDPSRLEQLLHRQDIHDCLLRFSRGMDRFDRELFISAFHDDAVIAAGEFVGKREDLYDWAQDLHEQAQTDTQHNLLNHSCDIEGDTAHAETYYLFLGRNRDDSNWAAGGRYIDRLERRGGEWRIALRTNAVEWSGMVPSQALPFEGVADLALNGVAGRNPEDPSYQRPLVNRRKLQFPPGFIRRD